MCTDYSKKYKEACESIRFYSSVIIRVRVLEIVQGMVVLTAAVYLAKEGRHGYSLFACCFGFLFTSVLYLQHLFYLRQFECLLEHVVSLEGSAEDELSGGTWSAYNSVRSEWFKSPLLKILSLNGSFILLLLSLFLIGVFNIGKIL